MYPNVSVQLHYVLVYNTAQSRLVTRSSILETIEARVWSIEDQNDWRTFRGSRSTVSRKQFYCCTLNNNEEQSAWLAVSLFVVVAGQKADPSKHVLLMDEVDGMAGNEDRGGMQVRIKHDCCLFCLFYVFVYYAFLFCFIFKGNLLFLFSSYIVLLFRAFIQRLTSIWQCTQWWCSVCARRV